MHYFTSIYLFAIVLWPLEAANSGCWPKAPAKANSMDVSGQAECQNLCLARPTCVGIVYTHKEGYTNICYLCDQDHLASFGLEMGFYRKQGMAYF